ncbi:MAG: TIGR00730 family Rossman fold protein [Spirochaetaceae bacterium]|nr:MAG: TIGR00730 family Rossman fold protein [Spirochaetaceae bacterium]
MNAVCVFCGSSTGSGSRYVDAAREAARELVARGITVVYGGGKVGLMGAVATTALDAGGRVIGVIPEHLFDREIAFDTLDELHVTDDMTARKAKMAALCDGFLVLPGGLGTLEEFSEVLSWAQIRLHDKPCGILNVDGYYDSLADFFDHSVREGFVRPESRALALIDSDVSRLLDRMESTARG